MMRRMRQDPRLRRELLTFLVVGCLTVGLDFISYRLLLALGIEPSPAKAAGFLTGTAFAYFANRRFTFGFRENIRKSALRFVLLYAMTLLVNIAVNHGALVVFSSVYGHITLAFLLATGCSTVLNFIGMKYFVFTFSNPVGK